MAGLDGRKISSPPGIDPGPSSPQSVAIQTELPGQNIESHWGEIFRTCPNRPWDPPSLLYNRYRVFPGGKERPGRDADPLPLLVPWSRKSRAVPLLPLYAVRPVQSLSACTKVHSLLVPWSRKSRAEPLLPLQAVRPVQSLSACTKVHFKHIASDHVLGLKSFNSSKLTTHNSLYLFTFLVHYKCYLLYRQRGEKRIQQGDDSKEAGKRN